MRLYQPAEETASAARQAALLLHAMPHADRVWVLGQLPAGQRSQLSTLVEELQQLGIPQDPGLIDLAVASGQANELQSAPLPITAEEIDALALERQFLEHLDAQGRMALSNLLRTEPPILVARFLALGQWPWKDAVLGQLGAVKRRQVEEYCQACVQTQEANSFATTLMTTVVEQLRAVLQKTSIQKTRKAEGPASRGAKLRSLWPQRFLRPFKRMGSSA